MRWQCRAQRTLAQKESLYGIVFGSEQGMTLATMEAYVFIRMSKTYSFAACNALPRWWSMRTNIVEEAVVCELLLGIMMCSVRLSVKSMACRLCPHSAQVPLGGFSMCSVPGCSNTLTLNCQLQLARH